MRSIVLKHPWKKKEALFPIVSVILKTQIRTIHHMKPASKAAQHWSSWALILHLFPNTEHLTVWWDGVHMYTNLWQQINYAQLVWSNFRALESHAWPSRKIPHIGIQCEWKKNNNNMWYSVLTSKKNCKL